MLMFSEKKDKRIHGNIIYLPPGAICPNPSQPRKTFDEDSLRKLAESVSRYGLLQPLCVRRGPWGTYELIAGERRLRAAAMLSLDKVPCVIYEADKGESAALAVIENLQREDLNMFEEAAAIASLIEIHALTQEEVATRLSVSQSYIANKLRLLRLDEEMRMKILKENLTERHARALLRLTNTEVRRKTLDKIIAKKMNVAMAEAYIETLLSEQTPQRKRRMQGAIRDIRLFTNSIDKAMELARRAGVAVSGKKEETEEEILLTIRIPKQKDEQGKTKENIKTLFTLAESV